MSVWIPNQIRVLNFSSYGELIDKKTAFELEKFDYLTVNDFDFAFSMVEGETVGTMTIIFEDDITTTDLGTDSYLEYFQITVNSDVAQFKQDVEFMQPRDASQSIKMIRAHSAFDLRSGRIVHMAMVLSNDPYP